jgi:hypothetical protein
MYSKDEIQKLKDECIIAVIPTKKVGGMALWSGILTGDWSLDPIFPKATQGMLAKRSTTEHYTEV